MTERKKIVLGGYEMWVEWDFQLCIVNIYDTEKSKHGTFAEIMGNDGDNENFWLVSNQLTSEEKKELKDFILQNK